MCREKGEKINVLAPGGVNSRSSSPNLITFLEWQLGQNQRPLQLNARRYSLRPGLRTSGNYVLIMGIVGSGNLFPIMEIYFHISIPF
jgi:hypothetical protein